MGQPLFSPHTGVDVKSDRQRDIEERLTRTVMDSFNAGQDERLTVLMKALVRHLHAFIRDVRLTEAEWNTAIEFLTDVGHITDDRRQEFILLSDVLGASMQTINVNNLAHGNATEATVFGPFFTENSPRIKNGGDLSGGAAGQPCWVEGTVTDVNGRPIPHARIEVWEATRTASTTCNTPTTESRPEPTCSATTTGTSASGPSPPPPTRSPTMARSAACSRPPDAHRCGHRICTSW
jgi:hypothetical protein